MFSNNRGSICPPSIKSIIQFQQCVSPLYYSLLMSDSSGLTVNLWFHLIRLTCAWYQPVSLWQMVIFARQLNLSRNFIRSLIFKVKTCSDIPVRCVTAGMCCVVRHFQNIILYYTDNVPPPHDSCCTDIPHKWDDALTFLLAPPCVA